MVCNTDACFSNVSGPRLFGKDEKKEKENKCDRCGRKVSKCQCPKEKLCLQCFKEVSKCECGYELIP